MESEKLFKHESIGKLILKTSIPSVVIIIMMMLYNMADIFFIGQTGDAMQVASVSIAGPIMSILSGLGTLIGAGGCAAIATQLGKGDTKLAKSMSSFSGWFSIGVGILFALFLISFMSPILAESGTSESTVEHTRTYLTILALGAPFIIFSSVMANLVRAQGAAKESMIGNMLGNVINMALDPIFISVLGLNVAGAAIATVLGNFVASVYFIVFMLGKKNELSLNPRYFSFKPKVSLKVLSLGFPTAFGIILMSFSTIIRNNVAAGYGDSVIAASGIAGRVAMIVSMIQLGISMGVQPAIAYNYGAGLFERMNAILKRTAISTVIIGVVLTATVFMGRATLVSIFLDNAEVSQLGQHIVALAMVTGPIFGIGFLCTTFLQSTNQATVATVVALLRQGIFLLPLTFILSAVFGLEGFLWSAVLADILSTLVNIVLFMRYNSTFYKSHKKHSETQEKQELQHKAQEMHELSQEQFPEAIETLRQQQDMQEAPQESHEDLQEALKIKENMPEALDGYSQTSQKNPEL
ncbi:MAG: MATE family efflux transporter [Clostridiales bacterium]|jgi:putative MATE family efflux protein|nr:MATE family efflux transporter [Clostridiales bacterium]